MIRIVKSYILSLLLVFFGHRLLSGPAAAESVGARQSARADRTVQAIAVPAYMAEKLIGESRSLPGWEGFNVRLYEYRTGRDIRTGAPKTGRVYLLNPEPGGWRGGLPRPAWKSKEASVSNIPTGCCGGYAGSRGAVPGAGRRLRSDGAARALRTVRVQRTA